MPVPPPPPPCSAHGPSCCEGGGVRTYVSDGGVDPAHADARSTHALHGAQQGNGPDQDSHAHPAVHGPYPTVNTKTALDDSNLIVESLLRVEPLYILFAFHLNLS